MKINLLSKLSLFSIATTTILSIAYASQPTDRATKLNRKDNFINPIAHSRQMILVIAKDWNATHGNLQRFERDSTHDPWKKVGHTIETSLGAHGLGWGVGLHGARLSPGPKIREGAKKSPVGVFSISLAFGKESATSLGVKMPYQPIKKGIFCPDDSASRSYNCIVDGTKVKKDWNSAEDMDKYMQAGLYEYGIKYDHNINPIIPYGGSCFFMHVSKVPKATTAGCTAFDRDSMKEILLWLDPKKKPVLTQLTEETYHRFKDAWQLPPIMVRLHSKRHHHDIFL